MRSFFLAPRLHALLLCGCAAATTIAIAACSSGQVTAASDAGSDASLAGDAALRDDASLSEAGDGSSIDGGSVDGGSIDGNTVDVHDAGSTCPFGDAMPDVARGPTCTGTAKAQRWAAMIQQPITLRNHAAGLDLRGAADAGLSLAQAEQVNCESSDLGDLFGDCTRVAGWGDNAEVWLDYAPTTGTGRFMVLYQGYLGALDFHSPDAVASYSIGLGRAIYKNGTVFVFETGWSGAAFDAEVDEVYRGLTATFAPEIALDPAGTTCITTHKCVVGNFGDVGYILYKALGFALWVPNIHAPNPTASTPYRFDVDLR